MTIDITELDNMKSKELKDYCNENDITVNAKTKGKPTVAEFKEAIINYESEGLADIDVITTEREELEELKDVDVKVLTKAEKLSIKRRIQRSELLRTERVIIRSNKDTQTKSEMEYITWGNDLVGHKTDIVIFDKPWTLRVGAVNNLKKATLMKSKPRSANNKMPVLVSSPAYSVEILPPFTQDELDVIGKSQTILDNSNQLFE